MCISGRLWFLRYGVQETIFFFFWILDHFLPFYLYDNLKNQYFEKAKKYLEIHTVPAIQPMTDVIFIFHFGLFFAILPTCVP